MPSGKQVPQCHGDGNFRILGVVPSASVGGGSSAFGGNDSNNLTSASGIEKGSAGSSFRSGGRGNLFFGADFAGQRQREVHALAEKTDVAEARLLGGAETATPLGVEGSSEEVYAEGHKLFGNVRGEGRGSECSKTLALDDAQVGVRVYVQARDVCDDMLCSALYFREEVCSKLFAALPSGRFFFLDMCDVLGVGRFL